LKKLVLILFCSLFLINSGLGVEIRYKGIFSGWISENHNTKWQNQTGGRYIPQLTMQQYFKKGKMFDIQASFHGLFLADQSSENRSDFELYRFKVRYTTQQSESQLGLQKINFGPAQILRALNWFDSPDLRDPLKLTNGVYAFRFRYTLLNNINLWIWETLPQDRLDDFNLPKNVKKPEFGWRFQAPVANGELGISLHSANSSSVLINTQNTSNVDKYTRVGFDGRWDILVGMWFETSYLQKNNNKILSKQITLGGDYTFDYKNGLYCLVEHTLLDNSDNLYFRSVIHQLSAISFSYPVSFFDNIMAIGYFDWTEERFYQYFSWQRNFDKLSINASIFNYSKNVEVEHSTTGCGAQIMLIYTH